MSNEAITFQKVVTYTLPELEWDNADAWYKNLEERLYNLNVQGMYNKGGIKINAGYSKQPKLVKDALEKRVANKNTNTGMYGYGKIMSQIIGEYVVTLNDKTALERKLSIMNEMVDRLNANVALTSEDPAGPEKVIDETLANIDAEDAVDLALRVVAIQENSAPKMGRVMGYIGNKMPHLKTQMKQIAGMAGPKIGEVSKRISSGDVEDLKTEALLIYPDAFTEKKDDFVKLKEPIQYQFKANDLNPEVILYQVNDSVKEIPLNILIKKMKNDKAEFEYFNQHKPNGGPQWPKSGSGNYYLVISNDPYLNYTKTTGRFWDGSSCEKNSNTSEMYSKGPVTDIEYGNCVVFAFKGDKLPEGWPERQPNKKDDILLGRQNIKWGYKESKEGDLGMGIDPGFYPYGSGGWKDLLNRALALIVDSLGYLNYNKLYTPYYYYGHCDVGSGTGNLTYSKGNRCITKIDNQMIDPNIFLAGNELINYQGLDRLSRPLIDKQIKMILAQNPNIWAISGNETAIGRLIATKDIDIIKLLILAPEADAEALAAMTQIMDIDPQWKNPTAKTSLPFLIANHPNATERVQELLLKNHPGYQMLGEDGLEKIDFSFQEVVYGGALDDSTLNVATPYLCNGTPKVIDYLLELLENNKANYAKGAVYERNDMWHYNIIVSLLFAPKATKQQLDRIYSHLSFCIKKSKSLRTPSIPEDLTALATIAYSSPLTVADSWAFEANPVVFGGSRKFTLAPYVNLVFNETRQDTNILEAISKEVSEEDWNILIQNTRDKKCFEWIWRKRRRFNIEPQMFTRYPISIEDKTKPSTERLFDTKHFMACIDDNRIWDTRYEFVLGNERILRKSYPPKYVNHIVSSRETIEMLGWGIVALWLNSQESFNKYIDVLYQTSFGKLYLGGNRFAPAPEDIFELYEMNQDIVNLPEAAVDSVMNEGGLARNPRLPVEVQKILLEKWVELSKTYEGNYEEYLTQIIMALVQNPSASPNILQEYSTQEVFKSDVAKNPNTYTKDLVKLFSEYPSEVLMNSGLTQPAYRKLWNLTWKTLQVPVGLNPDRLYDSFRINSVLERQKGSKIRNSLISYIPTQPYAKFWRAGNIKKGKFSQLRNQNLYTDPIADYPIVPEGKAIVVKFSDNPENYQKNEVYFVRMKKTSDTSIYVEGEWHHWIDGERVVIQIEEDTLIDDFFNFIPEGQRKTDITTTDDAGKEVVIKAPKWNVDNIAVIQDDTLYDQLAETPSWRYDVTQQNVDDMILSYLQRGMPLSNIIDVFENNPNFGNYSLTLSGLFKIIDENNLWTLEMINENLSYLMRNRGSIYNQMVNIPLTQNIMDLSAIIQQEDFKQYDIYDMQVQDLGPIQNKILHYPTVPISYVYYILSSANNSNAVNKAKAIRRKRAKEFIEYYRREFPPPK